MPRSNRQKQKRKQRQQQQRAGGDGAERHLQRLERQHTKLAALLHATDQQDQHIRQVAIKAHDQVNAQIAKLQKEIRAAKGHPDPELARTYGDLLKKRKQLQGVIVGHRDRHWERGHPSPI